MGRVRVGTSGFSYAEWKGTFYPEDLPAAKMLAYYAGRLSTVEINNTFYRMPTEKLLAGWAGQVPDDFSFVLKAPRRITHELRLRDAGEVAVAFAERSAPLGPRLGPALFQLPPFLKKDAVLLADFLAALPAGFRAAFEFRHESWLGDEVYEALRARGAALCIAESEDLATPLVATADWGYLRLRRQDYVDADVARWAERIRAQPWSDTHVFFKHEDSGAGPALAAKLVAALR
jgi:uncharacterized protein YecE (DUF72 family)